MSDITAVIGDLSTQIKVGWMIWVAWGVVLMGWYRHARVAVPVESLATRSAFMPTPVDMTHDPIDEGRVYADPTAFPVVQQ